jgi:hypothetical protein
MAEREGAVQLSNLIAFDEKSFSGRASIVWFWRKKHPGQAAVMSHGRTRQRKTVILPSSSTVEKFHIIWIFHGKNQKKVKVHILRWSCSPSLQ